MTIRSFTKRNSFWVESLLLLRLALPAAAGLLVFRSMGVATVYFVGQLGSSALAATGLAFAVANLTGYSVIVGFAGALQTYAGQAVGAKNYALLGLSLQRCLIFLWCVCAPVSALWLVSEPLLLLSGIDDALASSTAGFLQILIAGLWFNSVMVAILEWMRSQSYVLAPTGCIAAVAVAHVPITYLLVNTLGLGLSGAAIAISFSHFLELLLSIVYISLSGILKQSWVPWCKESFKQWGPLIKLAVPSFFMMIEWWTSEVLLLMAAHLDKPDTAVATMTIFQTTNAICSMLPLGLSVASGTRVSNALGSGNYLGAMHASQVTVLWGLVLMSLVGGLIAVGGRHWCLAFNADPDAVDVTLDTFTVLVPKVVLDGIQLSIAGIIRGSGKQSTAAPIMVLSYFGIGLPCAFWMAFILKKGVVGLCMGYLLGVIMHTFAYVGIWLATDWKEQALEALNRVNWIQAHDGFIKPQIRPRAPKADKILDVTEGHIAEANTGTTLEVPKSSLLRMYTIDLGSTWKPGRKPTYFAEYSSSPKKTGLSAGQAGVSC